MKATMLNLCENRQDVTLTAYLLVDSPELLNGKKRPAVLVCTGASGKVRLDGGDGSKQHEIGAS